MQKRTFSHTCRSLMVLCVAAGISILDISFLGSAYAGKPVKPPVLDPISAVLVYVRDGDIIVADASGQTKAVVHHLVNGGAPTWNPDKGADGKNREIAFVDTSLDDSEYCHAASRGLFILDVTQALTSVAAPECLVDLDRGDSPAWSDNGIVYSNRLLVGGSYDWDLFLIEPVPGSIPVNLTNSPNFNEISPSWSASGDMLAFITGPNDGSGSNLEAVDLMVAPVVISNTGELGLGVAKSLLPGTELETAIYVDSPDWANHSNVIVVNAVLPSDHEINIWVIDGDISNLNRSAANLTSTLPGGRSVDSWSADDSKIVLFSVVENTCTVKAKDHGWLLAIMPAEGVSEECINAFIGPSGTNARLNWPSGLDWLP